MKSDNFLNFLLVSGAKIFSLGALFIANIFVARLTGPSEFGYYSVSLSLIVLYDALLGAPLDNAVIRFSSFHREHPVRIRQIQGDVFWFKVLMSFAVLIGSLFFLDELSLLIYNNSEQQKLIPLTILSGMALVMIRSSSCFMQIHSRFKDFANIDALQGLFRLFLVLLLFLLSIDSSFIYLMIYGLSAFIVFIFYQFKVNQAFVFSDRAQAQDRKTMLSYIGVTSTIVILGTISGRVDIPLVSALGSSVDAGLYSVAAQFAMVGTLFASYMAIVFQPKLVEIAKNGHLEDLILKNIKIALLLSIIAIPVTLWLIPWLVPFLFGHEYQKSAEILQILVIGICVDLMILPVLMPYAILALPATIIKWEILITSTFFIIVFFFIEVSAISMAWLVTVIRVLKFLLYYLSVRFFLYNIRSEQIKTDT